MYCSILCLHAAFAVVLGFNPDLGVFGDTSMANSNPYAQYVNKNPSSGSLGGSSARFGTIQLASEQLNPEKKKIFKRMMNPGESEATEEELLKLASKKDPAKQPLLYQRHRGGSSQDPQQGDQSAGDIESGQISRGGSGAQGTSGFHPLQVEDSPPKRNMGQTGRSWWPFPSNKGTVHDPEATRKGIMNTVKCVGAACLVGSAMAQGFGTASQAGASWKLAKSQQAFNENFHKDLQHYIRTQQHLVRTQRHQAHAQDQQSLGLQNIANSLKESAQHQGKLADLQGQSLVAQARNNQVQDHLARAQQQTANAQMSTAMHNGVITNDGNIAILPGGHRGIPLPRWRPKQQPKANRKLKDSPELKQGEKNKDHRGSPKLKMG